MPLSVLGCTMSGFKEYDQYDALGLAELIASGNITAEEVLTEAIRRRDAVNPRINAVVHNMDDIAFEAIKKGLPDGPFRGVPFLLKDFSAAFEGVPMSNGSRALKNFIPDYDSELVKRFKAAGVVTFGKTSAPELAIVGSTEPHLHGICRNPWNLERSAGGSSGGSGAAVAAGIVPMASGGDGGGSLRIPGSCNGIVGFKASRGTVPHGPAGDPWYGQVQDGVLSRSVRDSAAMLDAIRGADIGAPYPAPPADGSLLQAVSKKPGKLRIAYSIEPIMRDGELDAECLTGLMKTVEELRVLGHKVEEATPAFNKEHLREGYFLRVIASVAGEVAEIEEKLGRKLALKELEDETWMLVQLGRAFSAARFDTANRRLYPQIRLFEHFMRDYDVFLTPTLGKPPVPHGYFRLDGIEKLISPLAKRYSMGPLVNHVDIISRLADKAFDWVTATMAFNITGNPSVSLPLHWSADKLPVGMMFTGRYGDDATLFRLAGQLEKAMPWKDRHPPVWAG